MLGLKGYCHHSWKAIAVVFKNRFMGLRRWFSEEEPLLCRHEDPVQSLSIHIKAEYDQLCVLVTPELGVETGDSWELAGQPA